VNRLAVLASLLLALPMLGSPPLEDDVFHRGMVEGRLSAVRWGPTELYDFIGAPSRPPSQLREHGVLPWFAADDLKVRFFRPLSSGILAGELTLVGDRAWISRLHSLAWFCVVLGLVVVVNERVLEPRAASLATLIYALSGGLLLPVSWPAARHELICTVFALLAFWWHVRARDDGWTPGRVLSPLAFAVGLLAGELTLGAVALIAAWEWLARADRWRDRLVAVTPIATVTLGYLVFYAVRDYGTRSTAAYVPLTLDLASAAAVLRHFGILAGELVAGTPSDAFGLAPLSVQTFGAVWGAAMVGAAWWLFSIARPHLDPREATAVRWMALASLAAALPGTLAIVGGRVLALALVPASGVASILIVRGWALRRDLRRGAPRAIASLIVVIIAFGHFITGPVMRVTIGLALGRVAQAQQDQAAALSPCRGVMVLVAASDPIIATYVPSMMSQKEHPPERVRVLSMAAVDHRIERVTPTGFDLVLAETPPARTLWERLFRRAPLPAGTHVQISSLDATVIEDAGGIPTRTRFDFGEPLDSPHLCFYQWRDGRIATLAPPKMGETIVLRHERGPTGQ
jgi:hypothetical protein